MAERATRADGRLRGSSQATFVSVQLHTAALTASWVSATARRAVLEASVCPTTTKTVVTAASVLPASKDLCVVTTCDDVHPARATAMPPVLTPRPTTTTAVSARQDSQVSGQG